MAILKNIVVECCYCKTQEATRSLTELAIKGWHSIKPAKTPQRDQLGWCPTCSIRFDVRD